MFRSLRTRLLASYVFAAMLLVLVGAVGVTAFTLMMFGVEARESVNAAASTALDEARLQLVRHHTLSAAAPDIVRRLVRPGLHVNVLAVNKDGSRSLLARGDADGPDQRVVVHTEKLTFLSPQGERGPSGPPPNGFGPPPHDGAMGPPRMGPGGPGPHDLGPRGFDRGRPFPLGLNYFLHLDWRVVAIPGGRIYISPVPAQLDRFVGAFWTVMLPVGLLIVLGAWLVGRYITNAALRPLVETTASLKRFAAGDFTPRPIVTRDRAEIGELVTAYNGAAAQVASAFEERRAAEAQMRQFVADASHELRTPLTVVMGFIDVLRRRGPGDPAAAARIYETMLAESRRMRALIDKLISLARLDNPTRRENELVDLRTIAGEVTAALQAIHPNSELIVRAHPGVTVYGDRYELHEAVSNLVENALKYAPGSPVEIDVHDAGDDAVVEVLDRGPGIPENERVRIFDRFFRGENRGEAEGFGLGLPIVKRAVERAGGTIGVDSRPGGGSRFTITLPRTTAREPVPVAV